VVVTGTRRSDVQSLRSTAPVDIVSAESLRASGATTLREALQSLVPSANIPDQSSGTYAASRYAKSISLRGLAPDQTLVLVNGKRRAASAMVINRIVYGRGAQGVDINSIPLSAVSHVEVLRDGAAAQYGSDAIAGVVNFVLRDAGDGGSLTLQAGNYGADRAAGGSPDPSGRIEGWKGLELPGDGFLTLSFDATNLYQPLDGHPDPRAYYFPGDPREATADKSWYAYQGPDEENRNVLLNAEIGLSEALRAYGFVNYGHSVKEARGQYLIPSDDRNVRAIYPDGVGGLTRPTVNDLSGAAGLKLDSGARGMLDLSVSYGRYRQVNKTPNAINPGLGGDSPIGFDLDSYENRLIDTTLSWVNGVDVGFLASDLTVTAGLSHRAERYEVGPGETDSWIHNGTLIPDGPNAGTLAPFGPGLRPEDAVLLKRTARGAFFDLEGDLTERLQLGLAGRFEDYSDFGSARSGRLSARYELTPAFAVRSTVSNGYRAPSLGQIGFATTSYQPLGLTAVSTRSLAVNNPIARALGATDLEAEKSTNYSLGVVFTPLSSLSVTLDAYQIKVRDRVSLSENLTGPLVSQIVTAAGSPDVRIANFFTNALDTRTRGIELVSRYGFGFGAGNRLDLSLAYSRHKTDVTRIGDTPPQLAGAGLRLVGRQAVGLIEAGAPDDKLVLSAQYSNGPWSVRFSPRRYGEYTDFHASVPANDQTYSPQWIADIDGTYTFQNAAFINLGARNVFDSYPDLQKPAIRLLGASKYSDLTPEGHAGLFYYARVGVAF